MGEEAAWRLPSLHVRTLRRHRLSMDALRSSTVRLGHRHTLRHWVTRNDRPMKEEKDRWYVWTCYRRPLKGNSDSRFIRPYVVFDTEDEAWDWLEERTDKRRPE